MTPPADIGLIGLAVMGQNLALNIADHGYRVSVYNRTTERTTEFLDGPARNHAIEGAPSLEEFAASLATPRKVILMVKAGKPVDAVIESLLPLLDAGDIVIDGGNSHFGDTSARVEQLSQRGIRFVGAGISGGEEGARHGPSIMPGGDAYVWPEISPVLQSIAAKVSDGTPCCDWVGPAGAGHFVKMVHNGIEYGDIQLLAEAYDIMHRGLGMSHQDMAATFDQWNAGRLESYLVEITADIMRETDDGAPLLEVILDAAGQKGTGRWTVETGLAEGVPVTLIAEAVFARGVSALKDERVEAAQHLGGPPSEYSDTDREAVLVDLEQALYASKIVSYTQGFMLMAQASQEYGWELDLGNIALLWREGCIIRAAFLERIRDAFAQSSDLGSLLLDPGFGDAVETAQTGWRSTVTRAIGAGIPVPAYSSALSFFDSYRTARLPANLIQALRDYFGAHTYERIDRPRGERFHTDWADTGGAVSSGTYDA